MERAACVLILVITIKVFLFTNFTHIGHPVHTMMYKDFFCAVSLSHISVIMADSILRLTDLKKDVPCDFQNDEVGKIRKNN